MPLVDRQAGRGISSAFGRTSALANHTLSGFANYAPSGFARTATFLWFEFAVVEDMLREPESAPDRAFHDE